MYSLLSFGDMIADSVRMEAYAAAIAKAVRPGDVVIDLGCGPGLFAVLACRAGARKVYAMDADSVVEVGRQVAKANGFADRIEFFEGDSRGIHLPERANLIVSDIRGTLPLYREAVPSMEDARLRFLLPNGLLIPQLDTLKAAVIEAEEFYTRITTPWQRVVPGLDFSPALHLTLNTTHRGKFKPEQLLTTPRSWYVVDYAAGAQSSIAGQLDFSTVKSGTAHGVCLWFEAQLLEGIGYSSGPGNGATIYGQVFLPWLEPVAVVAGQEISLELSADLVGSDYVWRWNAWIAAFGTNPARQFHQSTFEGAVFSPQSLLRNARDYVPKLSPEGEAERWLLQAMDGNMALEKIAKDAAQRFPNVFRGEEDSLRRAAALAEKFCR